MKQKLMVVVVLALSTLVSAQLPSRTIEQMKETAKHFKNSRRFHINYDKFADSTSVTVGAFGIDGIELSASASFKGDTLREVISEVVLKFQTTSVNGWEYLNNHDLFIIVDGERLAVDTPTHDGQVDYGSVTEWMRVTIPYATFAKIFNAKTVEMKLGHKEIKLNAEHFQAFRDFDSLINKKGRQ